jgi:carboxypeptidase family protein
MRKLQWLLTAAILLAAASSAQAQRTSATVRGTVRDSTQAVLPGVTVTVTNEETGRVREVVTNSEGIYVAPELPVGRYKVEAELSGFRRASRTGVILRVADEFAVDFELSAGDLNETITVEASSSPVKVLGGEVAGVITGEQVRELPLNGRNFLQLATLMPGVSAPDMLNVKDKGLLGGSDLSVSGSDVTANLWSVDGANNNDVGSNRTILVYPSLEAIQEFKILRNSYGPEFGGAGGAQINIVTRGGTNRIEGSVFYSGRSDALNAKNYFLEQADQPKEALKRNDFGGAIGGPIIRDKLHFFVNGEWNLEDRGSARVAFVPTEAERNGDFSGPRIAGCGHPIPIDPQTGQPFPGNRIPADRISPAGHAFLSLYALPNVTPVSGSCNNWVTSVTSPIDYRQLSGRADWSITDASRVMVRYTQDSWKNDAPSIQSNLWGDDPFPAVDSNWDQPSKSFVAALTQTIGNSATNTLQFSYSANKIEVTRGGLNVDLNNQVNGLMQPLLGYGNKQYGQDVAHPVFWGAAGYPALWNEAPFLNNQDLFVVKDDYTRVFGKHFTKVGVLASWNKKNEDTIGNGSDQHSRFWGAAGLPAWGNSGTGNVLADFLLKDMTWGFSEASAGRSAPQRWNDFEIYAADSWQVTPRVTFDYGLRYSLFFNPYVEDDRITSFVPELFDPALGADACNGVLQPPGTNFCQEAGALGGTEGPNRSLMDQDYNNFAPRLGVAWDIYGTGKTAVRAGLGKFYLRERLSPGLNIAGNPPFVTTISGARLLDSTAEPCEGCFSSTLGAPSRGREVEMHTPNNWQWNVSFQHEVWRNTTVEVGYVASHGYDLLRNFDVNQVRSGDINGNGVDDRLDYARAPSADLRPFGAFGNSAVTIWDHSGKSTYHSLQTQLISRFGRGSQFQASYTLSRSRANLALTNSDGALSVGVYKLDIDDPDSDWGRPETGRDHIFNASLIWMLPGLQDRARLVRAIFGDWEISSIVGAATGQPINIFVTGNLPDIATGPSGTGNWPNQTSHEVPNRTSEPCRPNGGRDEQIINQAAFTLDGFQLGTIGSARRGDCNGPGYFQTDLSFYKNFSFGGRTRFQFRWDIFNIFNNTNFLLTGLDNTFGVSNVVYNNADPTQATAITSATVSGGFGQATRTRDPRQMQIGFKILF